jgi:HEPN pEK499 p136
MKNISHDRNGTLIFAERTQKNLDFIASHAAAGSDVHPVTQAVLSLLGIIVFPWETSAINFMKRKELSSLTASGWPIPAASGDYHINDLGALVHALRNAIAHGSIEFDSDSRNPSEVMILFRSNSKRTHQWVWQIRADQLIEFCHRFSTNMRQQVE